MADKNKLKKISAELKKASKMHAAQAEKIENMSKGPSMINIAGAVAGLNNQKKSTAVGSVSPHSHDSSKDNAQPIPPITPPMPDNITGNIGNNFKVQELGKSMFQGEEMANQFAQRQMDKPVPPPGDAMGDQYGDMFNQPFAQNKIEKALVLEKPRLPKKFKMEPKKEKTKMYLPSKWRGTRHEVHRPKLEKPREMPRQVIQRVNMEGPLAQTKYRIPVEGVSGLQDLGAVKEDKKGQYVVNENATSVSDTLRFPPGTKHYSGRDYKKGQTIDETDYENIIKKVNKS